MEVDFIRHRKGKEGLELAARQQEQLSYFTRSSIQKEVNIEYLKQWANRNYMGNDHFLNWVKAVFKTENFLAFYKYFRSPLPSANLVNNRIREALSRVFHAEDSYFNYTIKGKDEKAPSELETEKFEKKLFDKLLFEHNAILIHDLQDINKPYREFVPIERVAAIESVDNEITRLSYHASIMVDGEEVKGYAYMDSEKYAFYDKDYKELLSVSHDLKVCPADYLASEAFGENDIVRRSIFSYSLEAFEEYVFLKTLLRMSEANGVIPITIELDAKVKKRQGNDTDGKKPMSAKEIAGQSAGYTSEVIGANNDSPLQAGNRIKVPAFRKSDGSIDTDAVQNFLKFLYVPIEALEYINDRIQQIEKNIISHVLGDYSEQNESAKNELQVEKSYINKQDRLRSFSLEMSRARNLSDKKFLSLQYGPDSVQVDCFYGSDFFLETQDELYDLFGKSPNSIERKNILVKLSQNRNRYNPSKAKREKLLYDLLPYSSDADFDKALERNVVGDEIFSLQTQFSHWIGRFESVYGDIVYFWEEVLEGSSDSVKLSTINNLITNLIKDYYVRNEANSTA